MPVNIIESLFHRSRIASVPADGHFLGESLHGLKREPADFLRRVCGLRRLDKAVPEREGSFHGESAFDGCACDQRNEGDKKILFLAQLIA